MPNDDLTQMIRVLEERLLSQGARTSRLELHGLLADDFVEFGGVGGSHDKASTINILLGETYHVNVVSEFRVREMSTNQAHATYRATDPDTGDTSRCSSVWRFEQGVWRLTFHRNTPNNRP
jgi:hypothetical protein